MLTQLKLHYRQIQQIEEVFYLLKHEFRWEASGAQRVRAQVAHLHLRLYVLCVISVLNIRSYPPERLPMAHTAIRIFS